MPTLSSYLRLAPFTVEELVEAANSVLRDRSRLHVSRRTVRYYVSERVLPPPGGSPKFARYEMGHLARLVAARCLGDAGRSLEAIRTELARFPEEAAAVSRVVQSLVEGSLRPQEDAEPTPSLPPSGLFRRIAVGRIVIEIPAELPHDDLVRELRTALEQFTEQ